MSNTMRSVGVGVCSFLLLSMVTFLLPVSSHGFGIVIDVTPTQLNLRNPGEVVTINTNIAYESVDPETVIVGFTDGSSEKTLVIEWWKADNKGEFVAKFEMSEVLAAIKEILGNKSGDIKITLTGQTTEAATFTGEQTITVIYYGR